MSFCFSNDYIPNIKDFSLILGFYGADNSFSFHRFKNTNSPKLKAEYEQFCLEQAAWLDDFALFMALKEYHGGSPWPT